MDRIPALSRSEIPEDILREILEEFCSPGRELACKAGHHCA